MSYENPGGPKGTLPDDNENKESTDVSGGAGTLGYQDHRDKSAKALTDAINSTDPGAGPMKTSTAGTYNFSKGFSLSDPSKPSFAKESISGMESAVSDASNITKAVPSFREKGPTTGTDVNISTKKKDPTVSKSDPNKGLSFGTGIPTFTTPETVVPLRSDVSKGLKESVKKQKSAVSDASEKAGDMAYSKGDYSGAVSEYNVAHKARGGKEDVFGTGTAHPSKGYEWEKNIGYGSGITGRKGINYPSASHVKETITPISLPKEEEYTTEGTMTGVGWQEKSAKYNKAAAETDKAKKPTFRERREAKKEAKWKGKEEKGLTKALTRQAKEEGLKKQTHGSLHVTKDGSTTKFGKGYSTSTRKKSGKLVKKIYDEEGKKLGKTVRGKQNKVKQTARNIKANKQAGAPTRSWGME